MPATVSTATVPWAAILAAIVAGLLIAGTGGLWAYFGTAVFFEMVRTGWMACF